MLPIKKQQCKRMETVNAQMKGLTGMIQMINIEKLSPHKDNPRKDLGDISELAESIKAAGILQNLTVVPYIGEVTGEPIEGSYKVIIGHRRLAAAKLAGLTELPCVISNMDYKEQIATMLLENMQRSDLTIYEQAEGFQMMLDLGESVNDISHKTGFSDTTVRRRVRLLDLDRDKFKKSVERGATLMDFAELEKIKDVELKNKVLERIGTSNFNWALREALDQESRQENRALIIAALEKFATKVQNDAGMQVVERYYSDDIAKVTVPDNDDEEAQYYFTVPEYGPIALLKKKSADEIGKENTAFDNEEAARKARKERYEALEYVSNQARELRRNFVFEVSNFTASKHIDAIIKFWIKEDMSGRYLLCPDAAEFAELLDAYCDEGEEPEFEDIEEVINERAMLVYVYLKVETNLTYFDYACRYKSNARLGSLYTMLTELGYEMSDEEKALENGSHSLFLAKESED